MMGDLATVIVETTYPSHHPWYQNYHYLNRPIQAHVIWKAAEKERGKSKKPPYYVHLLGNVIEQKEKTLTQNQRTLFNQNKFKGNNHHPSLKQVFRRKKRIRIDHSQ